MGPEDTDALCRGCAWTLPRASVLGCCNLNPLPAVTLAVMIAGLRGSCTSLQQVFKAEGGFGKPWTSAGVRSEGGLVQTVL